jgi:hypothetical protein
MELENIILSEVTQTQRDIHGMYSLKVDISQKKYRIPRIKSTELKKVNKLKDPSKGASIPLARKKKAIMGVGEEGGEWWGRGQGREEGNMIKYWAGAGRTGLKP